MDVLEGKVVIAHVSVLVLSLLMFPVSIFFVTVVSA
jgi:hypothetical protein